MLAYNNFSSPEADAIAGRGSMQAAPTQRGMAEVLRLQHALLAHRYKRTVTRPKLHATDRLALVTRMATANPLRGAPRIHGEVSFSSSVST
jgi:hypothetical protein